MTCTKCEQRRKIWKEKQRKAEEERKAAKAAAIGVALKVVDSVGKIIGSK